MWFAMELAKPLGACLGEQFAVDLPTGRLDHPEWLLSTALRLTRQYSPLLDDIFQVGPALHFALHLGPPPASSVPGWRVSGGLRG